MTDDAETDVPAPAAGDAPRARWQKARLPLLTAATTADAALQAIVLAGLDHLRGNEACVAARAHVEGVHQMRVAVRRLRSCLALYGAHLPEGDARHLNGELRWLIGELGPARDWDVFVSDILAPVLAASADEERIGELALHVEAQRDAAYARAQAAIADRRYTGLAMLLAAWAAGRRWREALTPSQRADLDQPCLALAHALIHQRYAEAIAVGAGFAELGAEERHRVRIRIKKLRYAVEFFGSLYAKRRVDPYLALLKELQDDLGAGNDVAVAKALLRRVMRSLRGRQRHRAAYAAGLVVGWHSHTANDLGARQARVWQRFLDRGPFWPVPKPPGTSRPAPAEPPRAADAEQPRPVAEDEVAL